MSEARQLEMLKSVYCGRLGTTGSDGWPYVVPLLYVWMKQHIYMHSSAAHGHLRQNIDLDPRACFEIDEPGAVFAYGRFACDTGTSYGSVIAFGRISFVHERDQKELFCEALMQKYALHLPERPKSFFPRLDDIAVFALAIERIAGKMTPLPAASEQWPAIDRTKTPNAVVPG
jgi:nitroimidazol reductase NimA-like FMN-containing flavoprotein (pyridoxamine 5'-phosphate oxidase superfamily)